ncbi:MAG TPA: hypothetical protein VGM75_34285 [Pseudonocardiaceae bacterium]
MANPEDNPAVQALNAAVATIGQHATNAASSADRAQGAADLAVATRTPQPSWIFALVIGILGLALIILIIGAVIAASNGKMVDTTIVSVVSLIAGGLIGVLAPSPQSGK